METKEMYLLDFLTGHDGEKIYSLLDGEITFKGIEFSYEKLCKKPIKTSAGNYNANGSYSTHSDALCLLFPSKDLYEKYPLNPAKAWKEWQESKKPKRWRAKEGEEYWFVSCNIP